MDNEIFDDYEDADLEAHGEEQTDKGPLQGDRQLDFDTGFDDPKYDAVEERTRSADYEGTPGRTRTGKEGELDLSRVNLDSGGRESGNAGGDWEGNFATKGMTAVDGTGYVSDTRGAPSMTGRHEDVDEELHQEMRGAGLRLGINSVNTLGAAYALANSVYMKNKLKWQYTPQWKRDLINEERRDRRANRAWDEVREASIQRHASGIYKGFVAEREWGWEYGDPEEIEQMDGVDTRSALQVANRWKMDDDIKRMDALVVKYAAALGGIKPRSMQANLRRKPELRQVAEVTFVLDAHACDALSFMPNGFDRERLLNQHGGDLVVMDTPMADLERRELMIDLVAGYYAAGGLFPGYVWDPVMPVIEGVVKLLEEAGVDLSIPEPEIDWSRV